MSLESFIKKYKVKNLYKYSENKDGQVIRFGWVRTNEIALDKRVVLSYPSKSKSFSDEDREWSKEEGVSAISYSDYMTYFKSLTSYYPDAFYKKIQENKASLKDEMSSKYKHFSEKDFDYVCRLSELLSTGKKFIIYGRIFRIVEISS